MASTGRAAADRATIQYRRLATQWETTIAEIKVSCDSSPTIVRRLASSSASWAGHHPHCEPVLMQRPQCRNVRRAPPCSNPASHSRRCRDAQGRLRQGNTASYYVRFFALSPYTHPRHPTCLQTNTMHLHGCIHTER
ncbi:hypothetical protein BDR05DRAFT_714017 [Suillus weaverae]|nr:hypothetical protein BDR05DRAFT_714017 [Suillus weaverae]